MIRFEGVSKSYNGVTRAVDDVSLEIHDGEIFGLIGLNGAGKSTLLKMLVGVLTPTAGTISVGGHDVVADALEAKRQHFFVDDSPDHLLNFKAYEYLNFIADIYGIDAETRERRVAQLAKTYEMEEHLGEQLQSFSHGMRQKTMIMGALLACPPVWVLDEPLTGLDPRASHILKNSMREHADAGNIVLFSTHVLEVAERMVDRVAVVNKGHLLFVGTLDEMRARYGAHDTLESMFLELTGDAAGSEDNASSGEVRLCAAHPWRRPPAQRFLTRKHPRALRPNSKLHVLSGALSPAASSLPKTLLRALHCPKEKSSALCFRSCYWF